MRMMLIFFTLHTLDALVSTIFKINIRIKKREVKHGIFIFLTKAFGVCLKITVEGFMTYALIKKRKKKNCMYVSIFKSTSNRPTLNTYTTLQLCAM